MINRGKRATERPMWIRWVSKIPQRLIGDPMDSSTIHMMMRRPGINGELDLLTYLLTSLKGWCSLTNRKCMSEMIYPKV